jgi:lipopolysaccharide export system protein LptA
VERVLATGNVHTQTRSSSGKSVSLAGRSNPAPTDAAQVIRGRADQAEFLLTGSRDLLRTATMTGNVHFEQTGPQAMQGDAGRVIMEFAGQNQLQKVHALDGARLTQRAASSGKPAAKGMANGPQDFELSAPVIDFAVDQGHILKHAETSGAAQITIAQAADANAQAATGQRTIVTAGKFVGEFTTAQGKNHLATLHGAPNARIVSAGPIGSTPVGSAAVASVSINSTPAPADRVSISDSVDAVFLPRGGIESITQTGNFVYTDNQQPTKRMQAWADSALYTPADQMLALSGSPRVAEGAMATTANSIRINRATGDALAEGDVKSTYSQMKEQPGGALLASSSPIHVTSRSMTAHNAGGVALYSGHARLWQDANIIEAPSIQFDRDRRFVTAQGTAGEPVQTILVQTAKAQTAEPPITGTSTGKRLPGGKEMAKGSGPAARSAGSSPIGITADRLTYADSERRVHYETGVVAKSADFTASAKTLDAYLLPRSQTAANQSFAGPGQLDRMVAQSDVVITQPNRRAEGQKLVYTAADDRFVLTGGASSVPPSIFDAEQGKITGVSLTFFRGDDRVLVEGEASTPVVTQTRVAR